MQRSCSDSHRAVQLGPGAKEEGQERRFLTLIPFPGHPPEKVVGRGYLKPDGIYSPLEQRIPAWPFHPGAAN